MSERTVTILGGLLLAVIVAVLLLSWASFELQSFRDGGYYGADNAWHSTR